jgi:hypothetical protein
MTRLTLTLVAVGTVALAMAGEAQAQPMPFFDINGWANTNVAFGQYMDQEARRVSWEIARRLPPGYVVPVNPNFMNGYRAASDRYIQGMQMNSQRTSDAIARWNSAANRGQWGYGNGYGGPAVMLPNTHNGYTVNPMTGQIQPGWTGNGQYLYPLNRW